MGCGCEASIKFMRLESLESLSFTRRQFDSGFGRSIAIMVNEDCGLARAGKGIV